MQFLHRHHSVLRSSLRVAPPVGGGGGGGGGLLVDSINTAVVKSVSIVVTEILWTIETSLLIQISDEEWHLSVRNTPYFAINIRSKKCIVSCFSKFEICLLVSCYTVQLNSWEPFKTGSVYCY